MIHLLLVPSHPAEPFDEHLRCIGAKQRIGNARMQRHVQHILSTQQDAFEEDLILADRVHGGGTDANFAEVDRKFKRVVPGLPRRLARVVAGDDKGQKRLLVACFIASVLCVTIGAVAMELGKRRQPVAGSDKQGGKKPGSDMECGAVDDCPFFVNPARASAGSAADSPRAAPSPAAATAGASVPITLE